MTLAGEEDVPIEGYASVFGMADGAGDVMHRGAFLRSLLGRPLSDIKMLWQHDPTQPIGRWLEAREDEVGLFVRGVLYGSLEQGREAGTMVKAGVLDGLSIGFKTRKASRKGRSGLRDLISVDLWEISLVTFPLLSSARLRTSL